MKKVNSITFVIIIALLSTLFICSKQNDLSNLDSVKDSISSTYNIYALKIPQNLKFCKENVPTNKNDVFERLDRELLVNTYWQSNGLLLFKRANKYFSIIEPILDKYNVPQDFKYLALIESGFLNVKSPAGAAGFWQILASTGREFGLEVNSYVDERYNIEKSTVVACKYLIKSKERLGSWTLAAAAYNKGVNGIERRLRDQNVSNYYDLLLNEETSRYVFRILALKEIFARPKYYGFNFSDSDLYNLRDYKEVKVNYPINNLVEFANTNNISYKELKQYNPWLRDTYLKNGSNKEYVIKIPLN